MKALVIISVLISTITASGYGGGPANYDFGYKVHGGYSGANFGHQESRHGYGTNGQYHVNLPDGRLQTVTYSVGNGHSGYIADVTYSGGHHYGGPHGGPYGVHHGGHAHGVY